MTLCYQHKTSPDRIFNRPSLSRPVPIVTNKDHTQLSKENQRMTSSGTEDSGVRTELRRDAVTNRWVIISSGRAKRPSDFKSKSPASSDRPCPFCIGNEHLCAPEIFRFPPGASDWTLRVVENLFPALRRGVPPQLPPAHSPPEIIEGVGFHDVVVESPIHSVNLSDLAPARIADVLLAYRTRIEQILGYESFEYVQVT